MDTLLVAAVICRIRCWSAESVGEMRKSKGINMDGGREKCKHRYVLVFSDDLGQMVCNVEASVINEELGVKAEWYSSPDFNDSEVEGLVRNYVDGVKVSYIENYCVIVDEQS